jgi:signal transduction histidine kinase
VRVALRARRRQYELRAQLAEGERREQELRESEARLEQRVAHRTALITLLHDVASAANQAGTLDEVLHFALERVGRFNQWCVGHAYAPAEDDPDVFVAVEAYYADDPQRYAAFHDVTAALRIHRGEGAPGRVWASGQPEWIAVPSERLVPARAALAAELSLQTAVAFPVTAGTEVVGVLEFLADRTIEPDRRLLTTLASIGAQLGRVVERSRGEQRVRRAERLASMGTFAAGFAHELNNPLTSILMTARHALKPEHERATLNTFFQEIIQDAERCARIIRSLQQFARHGPTERWTVDLNELAQRTVTLLRREGDEVPIELTPAPERALLMGNSIELEQGLAGVIRNAIQASHLGQPVQVQIAVDRDTVAAWVTDHGRGMSAVEKEHAFDPFYTTRGRQGRSGLGLSMAHGIVSEHSGTIEIDTQRGRGTILTLTFPRAPAAAVSGAL